MTDLSFSCLPMAFIRVGTLSWSKLQRHVPVKNTADMYELKLLKNQQNYVVLPSQSTMGGVLVGQEWGDNDYVFLANSLLDSTY